MLKVFLPSTLNFPPYTLNLLINPQTKKAINPQNSKLPHQSITFFSFSISLILSTRTVSLILTVSMTNLSRHFTCSILIVSPDTLYIKVSRTTMLSLNMLTSCRLVVSLSCCLSIFALLQLIANRANVIILATLSFLNSLSEFRNLSA